MGDGPGSGPDPFIVLVTAFGVAGDIFPSGIEIGLVFQSNRGVIEGGVYDPEFGLKVSFAIEIDKKFAGGFLGIDDNFHRFAGLIDQIALAIERFDTKPEFSIAWGLELKLSIAGGSRGIVGGGGLVFADGGPRVSGVGGDF